MYRDVKMDKVPVYLYVKDSSEDEERIKKYLDFAEIVYVIVDINNNKKAKHDAENWKCFKDEIFPLIRVGDKIKSLYLNPSDNMLNKFFPIDENMKFKVDSLKLYAASWCGDVVKAKKLLDAINVKYEETEIEEVEGAAAELMSWSLGRRVIPTIIMDNEVIMFNPPPQTLLWLFT